tara:strand:- start:11 stop:340 length:330 start_codon:yes stop_codon:yes gene_type:complete
MTTKHYRDADGNYIGSFISESGDHPNVPDGAIESPKPPSGKAKWVDGAWAYKAPYKPARQALYSAAGVSDEERLDALWDKIMEGSDVKANDLKTKRDQVRSADNFPEKS